MENGASSQGFPNQEDKSGRPLYAATSSRNSSTIDPRSIQAINRRRETAFRRVLNRMRAFFKMT